MVPMSKAAQHGIARRQALDDQVKNIPSTSPGTVLGGDKDFAADLEQNPRQQRRREAGIRLTGSQAQVRRPSPVPHR